MTVATLSAPPAAGRTLALTPGRTLALREAIDGEQVDEAMARRIEAALDRGAGHLLLDLGAVHVDTALPPAVGFWRDLGRLFVTHLCAQPDLEATRRRLHVPFPTADAAALVAGAPPMPGGEYLDTETLTGLWEETNAACREELDAFEGTVEAYLQSRHAAWHVVGRVHFHLAENRAEPDAPFAFMATYSTRLSGRGRPQHRPLGEAIREYAGAGNRPTLLALLAPVQRAAAQSSWLRELVDGGDVYQPLALSPDEAYRFLQDIPLYEASGVVVRVPDWWKARRPPRPQVQVTVGSRAPSGLGTDALLDFDVRLTLDGQTLTEAEIARVASSSGGLALLRGKWVELDAERLREALEHWKKVERAARKDGLSFVEGMRLLAGARDEAGADAGALGDPAAWAGVVAGPWLAETLGALRDPDGLRGARPPRALGAELRPYQEVGLRWLTVLERLGLGACLADDMGLGKTVQVLALLLVLKERRRAARGQGPALLVVPASLIANWRAEIDRFAPSLAVVVAHPSAPEGMPDAPSGEELEDVDLVVTTYGLTHRLAWLAGVEWGLVILDEAQAIKNPGAKQTRAVKALRGRSRVALTGTPVENRLTDLWSIFDFLNPGLLGSLRSFASLATQLGKRAGGYAPLRELTRPYILRRLKTDRRVISDLPDKTEMRAFCALTKVQAALYQQAVKALAETLASVDRGIERRGAVLASLMRFKQICNHPSQWLRDGAWAPADSGKFARLRELAEVVAERQDKALVFTQFREIAEPLAAFLEAAVGRPALVMHGATPVRERRELVERFQEDPGVPFFVLSLKVGGTGLNLTAASHVIHFDRWWNPAVEDQATDRAFRIGQKKNVLVHKFICRGTVEERIDELIASKQGMARSVLEAGGEALLTEMSDEELLRTVALDLRAATEAA
jgi:non-specific serine/threonine protein kinase